MRKAAISGVDRSVAGGLRRGAAPADVPHPADFGAQDNVINLKPELTPYHAPGGPEADGSVWYMASITNNSVRPAIRVLLAAQPPGLALRLLPRRTRPAILAVASSDSGVVVEPAKAYGARAWRVIIPPVTQVGLALRVGNAAAPPSLQAWTEPALASHNRQLAIFVTAVGSLIAAAALITGGLAILIEAFRATLGSAYSLHAVVELAGGHRHVRRQPRHRDRRPLWPLGFPDGVGAGGRRTACGFDCAGTRSIARPSLAFSHRALRSVCIGRLGLCGCARRHIPHRQHNRARAAPPSRPI